MKNPGKFLTVLLTVLLLATSVVPAFAADAASGGISADAKICADLGMLQGSGAGVTAQYTATAPTRLQVAILYLRLKGLETDALAFTGTENFSDAASVYAEGKRIMAYFKANPALGFVGSNGKFTPNEKATAQQYYKVLLTALGYMEDVDFTYKDVFTFAATKGLSKLTADTKFTVDALAVATVEALNAQVNGGKDTLAGVLVNEKKLDAAKVTAAGILTTTASAQPIDSTATYMSKGENFGWQDSIYTLGDNTTGKQYASFDMTALIEKVDSSVDFADGQTVVGGFSDLAMLIRMNDKGSFDVRDGKTNNTQRALVEVPYSANLAYHVEVYADMNAKTYSVYVTPPKGQRTEIAKDFGFRTSAATADDMGQVFFVSAAANDQMKIEKFVRRAMLDSTAAYTSKGENLGWQENGLYLGSSNTGKQQIDFDMTALIEKADASVDFADSSTLVGGFADLAMLIRMNDQGFFDVRDGKTNNTQRALAQVPFKANVKYHVTVLADMNAKTYSVDITTPEGVKTQIAKDFGFRTTAATADDVGQMFVVSASDNNQMKAEKITIKAVN